MVPVEAMGPTDRTGTPPTIVTAAYAVPGPWRAYDVSSDGQRFLVMKQSTSSQQDASPPSFIVVQNWFEELRRLVPSK
jgi:hypothetical protein